MQTSFIKAGVTLLLIYAVISFLIVSYKDYSVEFGKAFIFAGFLGSVNIFLNIFFVVKNLKKRNNDFIQSFWKSILVRMFILLGMFFTTLVNVHLNHFVFTAAFFILYFLFQIIEIYILHTAKLFR